MQKINILMKKKLLFLMSIFEIVILALCVRVFMIEAIEADFWQSKAYEQQTRDRLIAPIRGTIFDRNMNGIAKTETVASVSVIHTQIKEPEKVAKILSDKLDIPYEKVINKIQKRVALERIKIKVPKDLSDEIRQLNLPGVVVDEDIKRVYPYSNLASQVIGFVGKDNQGIIGLEAKYDKFLKGTHGKIMTETDASGHELKHGQEYRKEPVPGDNLILSLDIVLQQYAEQTLEKAIEAKGAKRGAIIMLNPQSGEIYAMANKPDFDLNNPFDLTPDVMSQLVNIEEELRNKNNDIRLSANKSTRKILTEGEIKERAKNEALNQVWRNFSINDTYEPGSTFKIITSAAGLEKGVITPSSRFNCNGSKIVAGRPIKCWRYPRNHGSESFVEGVQNSCNPVFMDVAERLGPEIFYKYMHKFGFNEKTGVDLPGEAVGIIHKLKNIGPVELASMSFGQSFQITPLQLMRAVSAVVNGGNLITPHFAIKLLEPTTNIAKEINYNNTTRVISKKTSETMKWILESVVSKGTGNKTYIPGYRVGGKTATSEKLPRRSGKYIASFLAFAPAENPILMTLVLIDEPQGIYYGGQVAGPIMKEILSNALPYLMIKPQYTESELNLSDIKEISVPRLINIKLSDAKTQLDKLKIKYEIIGNGETVHRQFPIPYEKINTNTKIIIYTD
jgi:stage V sporulation protein D (sporulation-specific penicillin-binding protein)